MWKGCICIVVTFALFLWIFQHNNVPAADSLCIDYLSKYVTSDGGTRCLRFPCTTADTLLAQLLQAYVLLIVCTRLNNANLHSGRVCHSIVRKSTADSMLISDSTRITFSFTSEFDLCAACRSVRERLVRSVPFLAVWNILQGSGRPGGLPPEIVCNLFISKRV